MIPRVLLLLFLLTSSALAAPPVMMIHDAEDAGLAAEIQREAEAALGSWQGALGPEPLRIILAPNSSEFSKEARGRNPEWAAALILESGRTVLLDKTRFFQVEDRRRILRHEIGHIVLDRALPRARLPRWFHEGFAQVFAAEWEERDQWLLGRVAWFGGGIPLAELRSRFPSGGSRANLAYAESQAAVLWLWKDQPAWQRLFADLARGVPMDEALPLGYDLSGLGFEEYFDDEILPGYRSLGLLYGGGPLLSLGLVLFLIGYLRRRRRRKPSTMGPDGELSYDAAWLEREKLKSGGGRVIPRRRRRPKRPPGRLN
jgi:hypothetical protein